MSQTKIEWAEETWNPITGCTKISPGCAVLAAERSESVSTKIEWAENG